MFIFPSSFLMLVVYWLEHCIVHIVAPIKEHHWTTSSDNIACPNHRNHIGSVNPWTKLYRSCLMIISRSVKSDRYNMCNLKESLHFKVYKWCLFQITNLCSTLNTSINIWTYKADIGSMLPDLSILQDVTETINYKTVLLRDRKRRTARAPPTLCRHFCVAIFCVAIFPKKKIFFFK